MCKEEFAVIIAQLNCVFRTNTDAPTLDTYYDLIKDLDFKVTLKAVKKIMLTYKYFPVPAIIREEYTKLIYGERLSGLEAYDIFNRYCRRGTYTDEKDIIRLKNDYPEIYEVAKMIGFNAIHCGSESFIRPEFERMFEKYQDREQKGNILPRGFEEECRKISQKVYALTEGGEE